MESLSNKFVSSKYLKEIKGIFTSEPVKIGDKVAYNQIEYEVKKIIKFKACYYPKGNRYVFKIGYASINSPTMIKKALFDGGITKIQDFAHVYMNGCFQTDDYMYKELYFCRFKELTIFDM